jgi:RNA polymerase sigma factor (sigma-70 family)
MEVNMTTQSNTNLNLSSKAIEDYDLVLEAIAGNQKSYGTLMSRYRQSIFNMMYKMVNHRDDAEDLTLEAFGKAFNKLPSYAPKYAFSTWLFKIAINNCIDHIRKKRIKFLSIDEPIQSNGAREHSINVKGYAPDPESIMIRDQKIEMMRSLLTKLSPRYRTMIELRFFEELSYEEIAQELDIPLGTVKAQLFRAKEILHSMMQTPFAKSFIEIPGRSEKESMGVAVSG